MVLIYPTKKKTQRSVTFQGAWLKPGQKSKFAQKHTVKEPNVCKHLAGEDKARDNPTKDINVDLQVGGGIYKGELWKSC